MLFASVHSFWIVAVILKISWIKLLDPTPNSSGHIEEEKNQATSLHLVLSVYAFQQHMFLCANILLEKHQWGRICPVNCKDQCCSPSQPGSQHCAWGILMYTDVFLIWWPSFLAGTSSEVSQGKWPESGMKSKNCMHYLCPRSVVNSKQGSWKKGIASYQNVFLRLSIFCRSKLKNYCQQALRSNINCSRTVQLLNQFYWDTLGIRSPLKWDPQKNCPLQQHSLTRFVCRYYGARTTWASGNGPDQDEHGFESSTSTSEGNPSKLVMAGLWAGSRAPHLSHPHTVCFYTGTRRAKAASTMQRCRYGTLVLTLYRALSMGGGSDSTSTQRGLPLNLTCKDADWHILRAVDHGNTNQTSAPFQWLLKFSALWEICAWASGENC